MTQQLYHGVLYQAAKFMCETTVPDRHGYLLQTPSTEEIRNAAMTRPLEGRSSGLADSIATADEMVPSRPQRTRKPPDRYEPGFA